MILQNMFGINESLNYIIKYFDKIRYCEFGLKQKYQNKSSVLIYWTLR